MNSRLKKLVGTVVFVVWTTCYFLFAMSVAIARLPGTSMGAQLLFYLIITLIWLCFSGLLIRWMQKPGPAS